MLPQPTAAEEDSPVLRPGATPHLRSSPQCGPAGAEVVQGFQVPLQMLLYTPAKLIFEMGNKF